MFLHTLMNIIGCLIICVELSRCIQGDHSACSKPPVDIDLKVAF